MPEVAPQDLDLPPRARVHQNRYGRPNVSEDRRRIDDGDGMRDVGEDGVHHGGEVLHVMQVPQDGERDAADVDHNRAVHHAPLAQGGSVVCLHQVLHGEDERVHHQRLQPLADDTLDVPIAHASHHDRSAAARPHRQSGAAEVPLRQRCPLRSRRAAPSARAVGFAPLAHERVQRVVPPPCVRPSDHGLRTVAVALKRQETHEHERMLQV
mmetsp:Transcript_107544/g.310800  ORF Transcript_107544/g.310800 Transcript_107544/m.310800 type:complete len:210 (+) Transcript_107544:374-1003(+)